MAKKNPDKKIDGTNNVHGIIKALNHVANIDIFQLQTVKGYTYFRNLTFLRIRQRFLFWICSWDYNYNFESHLVRLFFCPFL